MDDAQEYICANRWRRFPFPDIPFLGLIDRAGYVCLSPQQWSNYFLVARKQLSVGTLAVDELPRTRSLILLHKHRTEGGASKWFFNIVIGNHKIPLHKNRLEGASSPQFHFQLRNDANALPVTMSAIASASKLFPAPIFGAVNPCIGAVAIDLRTSEVRIPEMATDSLSGFAKGKP